MLIYKKI